MARLTIVDALGVENEIGRLFPLGRQPETYIGRDSEIDIPLDDPNVCRRHAIVRYDNDLDRHYVIGADSKMTIYVNDVRIEGEAELQDGDRIRIANTTLRYSAREE